MGVSMKLAPLEEEAYLQSEELWCGLVKLEYDFVNRLGVIYFPEGHCCDCTGCLNLFKRIDPRVKTIITVAGKYLDTRYTRIDTKLVCIPDPYPHVLWEEAKKTLLPK